MKLFTKFGVTLLRGVFRQLSRLSKAIEVGVDSYRQVHGLDLVFTQPEEPPVFTRHLAGSALNDGDYLKVWAIEELAREQRISIDHTTDLEQLARDQGWMDAGGEFLLLPLSARYELGESDAQELMGRGGRQ